MAVIGVVSLGCDKNRVDTEVIMTSLAQSGHTFCAEYEEADVLLVNTCAFLEAAREESIDAILEAAAYKRGKCRCLAVAGCLPMRYLEELRGELPEVDLWLVPELYDLAGPLVDERLGEWRETVSVSARRLTTPEHYAYLKIADGCDNRCTYCMIPSIRGSYRSRPREEILAEAVTLVQGGVRELILVAQDTTRYGTDRPVEGTLAALVRSLCRIDGLETVRLLYCYPECVTDELIETIAQEPKVAKALDLPLQHVSDTVLKRMNRRSTERSIRALLDELRRRIPGIAIRTTLMVGFPGETEEDIDRLIAFLEEEKLDHVGFFAYSKEEDTPSALMDGHLSEEIKLERLSRVSAVQQRIAEERNRAAIGEVRNVLYEGIDYDRERFVGRPRASAPDVDPVVYFTAPFADIGERYDVKITGYDGVDLLGEAIESSSER